MSDDRQVLWADRLVRSGWDAPEQLLAHPGNPKIHPRPQTEAVKGSLRELGWLKKIKVNLRTGEEWGPDQGVETVFDGHDRIKAAMEEGQPRVPVDYYDLSPDEEIKAILYIDQTTRMSVYDAELLEPILYDISTGEAALMAMVAELAEQEGIIPPDFEPVPAADQPKLDRKKTKPVTCPECGHEFEA